MSIVNELVQDREQLCIIRFSCDVSCTMHFPVAAHPHAMSRDDLIPKITRRHCRTTRKGFLLAIAQVEYDLGVSVIDLPPT